MSALLSAVVKDPKLDGVRALMRGDRVEVAMPNRGTIRRGTVAGFSRDRECSIVVYDGNRASARHSVWNGFIRQLERAHTENLQSIGTDLR